MYLSGMLTRPEVYETEARPRPQGRGQGRGRGQSGLFTVAVAKEHIAINETTRPDNTRPRLQCLEAEAEAIAIKAKAKAKASFFGLEAESCPRT